MAKQCDLCKRGSSRDAQRSHSNIKTIKRQYVNLQSKKIDGATLKVCTRCIKTSEKVKKVRVKKTGPRKVVVKKAKAVKKAK